MFEHVFLYESVHYSTPITPRPGPPPTPGGRARARRRGTAGRHAAGGDY